MNSASPHGLSPSRPGTAPYHIIEWEAVFVHHSKIGGRLTALGQKPALPRRSIGVRFALNKQTPTGGGFTTLCAIT